MFVDPMINPIDLVTGKKDGGGSSSQCPEEDACRFFHHQRGGANLRRGSTESDQTVVLEQDGSGNSPLLAPKGFDPLADCLCERDPRIDVRHEDGARAAADNLVRKESATGKIRSMLGAKQRKRRFRMRVSDKIYARERQQPRVKRRFDGRFAILRAQPGRHQNLLDFLIERAELVQQSQDPRTIRKREPGGIQRPKMRAARFHQERSFIHARGNIPLAEQREPTSLRAQLVSQPEKLVSSFLGRRVHSIIMQGGRRHVCNPFG